METTSHYNIGDTVIYQLTGRTGTIVSQRAARNGGMECCIEPAEPLFAADNSPVWVPAHQLREANSA